MLMWTLAVGALIILWLYKLNEDYYVLAFFAKRIKTVDGTPLELTAPAPKTRTIFGHTFNMYGFNPVQIFHYFRENAANLKQSYIMYTLGFAQYNIITAEDVELVLNDPNLIKKGMLYRFVSDFLGDGLLSTTDQKWHNRRKLLTPAFHFNILTELEEVIKEGSRKFVRSLEQDIGKELSLSKLIPLFTLNTVCETALGVNLDERLDAYDYRKSFDMIEEYFVKRVTTAWYFSDRIYKFFEAHNVGPHIQVVHEFSSGIIAKRRQIFRDELKTKQSSKPNNDDEFMPKKKRYAMLDTLLKAEIEGDIDHVGICEEVDTFMFAGFDTTSMTLIFSLMNLAIHQDMQEQCYQEILELVDDDLTKVDMAQLNSLKYLDCFVKETQRAYPAVPSVQRETVGVTNLGNLILPHGTQLVLHLYDIMHDPRHFPNPNVFDPDRFLPENSQQRHPFAFIPFSAGQRNCIGQRFAMLEVKTLLVYILKAFKILPTMEYPSATGLAMSLITRTDQEIKAKFVRRS